MFRLWDRTTFCIFSNTSLPLETRTRLQIVLSSSLLYPHNTSITMLNHFTWYPGSSLFNSSRSGAYFSVFSQLLVAMLFSQGLLISSKVTDVAVLSTIQASTLLALTVTWSAYTMAVHCPPDLGCAASQRRLFSTPHYAIADIWTVQAPSIQPICVPQSKLPCHITGTLSRLVLFLYTSYDTLESCTAENHTNSEFKSSLQHADTQFNSKKSLHPNIWVKFVQCIAKNTSHKL